VLFERDAEFFGAFAHVFAAHAFGEGLIFQAALYGVDFEIEDAFRGADVRAGSEKAGEFVASEEGVLEGCLARYAGIIGVREDGADDFFGIAALAENFGAFRGMLFVGGVLVVGPALVIEVVEEGGEVTTGPVGGAPVAVAVLVIVTVAFCRTAPV